MERDPKLIKELEAQELKEKIEQFKEELEGAADGVRCLGGRFPFEDFESYAILRNHQDKMAAVLKKQFGFDAKKAKELLVKE